MSVLLRGITSNHNGDFYCLNCFRSYSTKYRLKKHERLCNHRDDCHVEMPDEDNKLLKYNHREKSLKVPFMIYPYLECLLEKMHSCQNNPKKSYTEKKLSIRLHVTHGLHVVHLMHQKTNLVITEGKTV